MRLFWLVFACICALCYACYISLDSQEDNAENYYDMFHYASMEMGLIKARNQDLKNVLAAIFSGPEFNYSAVDKILEDFDKAQNKSLNALNGIHKDEKLRQEINQYNEDLSEARRLLAIAAKASSSPDFVPANLNSEIIQEIEKINAVLESIGKNIDLEAVQNQQKFQERQFLFKTAVVFLCLFVSCVLVYIALQARAKRWKTAGQDKLFDQLSKNVNEVFLIINNKNKIDYLSSNINRLLGVTPEEIKGNIDNLYKYLGAEGEQLKKSFDEHENPRKQNFTIELEDARQLEITAYPLQEEETLRGKLLVIKDATEEAAKRKVLKEACELARQANETKSKFLAHMSHEIRTPLNAIIGMASIAVAKKNDQARVADCLDKIIHASRFLLGLINDVLDMSRIERGKMTLTVGEFDLKVAIENAVNVIKPQAEAKKQILETSFLNVDDQILIGDELRLNQILINLLSNAVKYTHDGGKIKFTIEQLLKKEHDALRFTVEDNGIGMSREFQRKLYQPFEQASSGVSSTFGGAGLGLAITKNLVEMMNGKIIIKSEKDKGTKVTVDLSFKVLDKVHAKSLKDLEPRKILVIDDDPDACEHAAILLERMGMQVEKVRSGKLAVALLKIAKEQNQPFEICLLDWNMPDMNGEITAREISALFGDEITIIIVSAYQWQDIEKRATAAGASGWLAKPLLPALVHNKLLSLTRKIEIPPEQYEEESDRKYDFSGKRILVVEDNEFNREITNDFLETVNVITENAENGRLAVDMFRDSTAGYYDLILMDIQMPVMNGYDATRAIRRQKRPDAQVIPIIALTANAFKEDVIEALESGMNNHIPKPINVKELYKKLAKFLDENEQTHFSDDAESKKKILNHEIA